MRILIGLIEHMGDIVACEPVVRYLRFNHPDAELSWAVSPAYRELVDTNPYIDRTIVLDCLTEWIRLRHHSDYDRIVDLHVNYRICQHCRVPLTKVHGNPFVNVYEWFDYGALLEAFSVGAGLPRLSAQPALYLKAEHLAAIDALNLPDDFCVVHRFSNSIDKDWTEDGWQEVGAFIRDELGLPIVEVGAGALANSLAPLEGAISLVNRIPILQTAAVIGRARFFLGVDSGPAHLANAQRIPGIVLLGRLGYFRQYSPYTGFYATNSPAVKMVRNWLGPVREIKPATVAEAVGYVNAAARLTEPTRLPAAPLPRAEGWPAPLEPGAAEILASGLFDIGWYALAYPEVVAGPFHPVDHYIGEGVALGYDASAAFRTKDYLERAPWLAQTGENPLLHYIRHGWHEGIRLPPSDPGPLGEPKPGPGPVTTISSMLAAGCEETSVPPDAGGGLPQIFAFYLPQFHPIPENNWAHGSGFTEWHNVIKTKPQFRGHYQPRIPGELGFYDLRAEETLREQIRLAREHGITGFCFYYYYFQGQKLLNTPLENYMRSDIDAPFLLLWANENWSKRWDGGDREVIVAQQHSQEDDIAFLRELAPLFRDPRYVKIDGKPVLIIYKTHLFPDIAGTVELWRTEIVSLGFPGIYLVMADDWNGELHHPRDFGFDASYEIPSNVLPAEVTSTETEALELSPDFAGRIVDYAKFARYHLGRPFPTYKRFRTVMLPWDNTPRYGTQAIIHVNGHGDSYKLWLLQALLDSYRRYPRNERLVFLHSWNEWCEGTYLEPDGKYGRFFLEQTKEAIGIAHEAVRRTETLPTELVAAELLKLQKAKDEGAFLVMSATRWQAYYAYGDLARERREMAQLRDQMIAMSAQFRQREADSAALAQINDELDRSSREARKMVEAIRKSTSWRLTAPLRKAVSLLTGR